MNIMNTLFAAASITALPLLPRMRCRSRPIRYHYSHYPCGRWLRTRRLARSMGHCRNTPYSGPLPGAGIKFRAGNGFPPGYWRGPWGHCRNTPFHGRLPDGSFQ